MAQYADEETRELLAKTTEVEASVNERDIADLAGGVREPTYQNIQDVSGAQKSFRIPQSMVALLQQREEKFRRIIKEGRTGTVTFTDIKLPDDPENKGEVE